MHWSLKFPLEPKITDSSDLFIVFVLHSCHRDIHIRKFSLFLDGKVSELALDSLLGRCSDVLAKYVEDEKLSGKCPLPR